MSNIDRTVVDIEPAQNKPKINALCCHRGMAATINEMLAWGCFTPQEIVQCIMNKTKHGTPAAAVKKLKEHMRNMAQNGGNIRMHGEHVQCADIFFPPEKEVKVKKVKEADNA